MMSDQEYSALCEDLRDTLNEFSEMIQDIRLNWRERTSRDCPFEHYDVVVDIYHITEELSRESSVIKRYLDAVAEQGRDRILH